MLNLSIVIPVYNVAKYLRRCIDSILAQQLPDRDYEVILINDGSTDNSSEIALEYVNSHSNIKLYHQQNQGLSATRNRGIELAEGKFIFFMDSDDFLFPNSLSKIYNSYFTAQPAMLTQDNHWVDIITFGFYLGYPETASQDMLQSSCSNQMLTNSYNGQEYISMYDYHDSACWFLLNRQYILNLGLTFKPGKLIEDMAFTTELFLNANKVIRYNIYTYFYVQNPGTIMSTKNISRCRKLLEGYLFSASAMKQIMSKFSSCSKECMRVIQAHQQNKVWDGVQHSLKYGTPKETETLISYLEMPYYPDGWNISLKSYMFYFFINNSFVRKPLLHAAHRLRLWSKGY